MSSSLLSLLALTAAACIVPTGVALAQPAPDVAAHDIPQSLRVEHEETMDRLTVLAKRPGVVGAAATRALALFKAHTQREQDYIMPPLTLLPQLADGKVTPDMAWAMAMTDKVKADREQIFQEHVAVTDVLNDLYAAGEKAHDAEAMAFARSAATDSLNDIEMLEPTVMLIGEYLHSKLPAAQ
ncbi:MAG: hypothetical protein ACHP7N_04915 [Caulobacterales bacterium]